MPEKTTKSATKSTEKKAAPEPEAPSGGVEVPDPKAVVREPNPPEGPVEIGQDGKSPVTPNNPPSKAMLGEPAMGADTVKDSEKDSKS